ncbi:hypothetical protein TIFTF001_040802 [Ficus carica]|uniref:Uncharacterized protein n=1 Tax=Ficus carica TaxID=3494 RepID=A0AA87YXV0_FICCA|nr:hypothetical protein TIFTF001_040802 [Ficus carica]
MRIGGREEELFVGALQKSVRATMAPFWWCLGSSKICPQRHGEFVERLGTWLAELLRLRAPRSAKAF